MRGAVLQALPTLALSFGLALLLQRPQKLTPASVLQSKQ